MPNSCFRSQTPRHNRASLIDAAAARIQFAISLDPTASLDCGVHDSCGQNSRDSLANVDSERQLHFDHLRNPASAVLVSAMRRKSPNRISTSGILPARCETSEFDQSISMKDFT
jgi:hypothetical protein